MIDLMETLYAERDALHAELTGVYARLQAAHEERDALQARIDGSMVVKASRNGIVRSEARMSLIGKRVALVVLEPEDGK